MGSVSQYCVENAKCSVWVVKGEHVEQEQESKPSKVETIDMSVS